MGPDHVRSLSLPILAVLAILVAGTTCVSRAAAQTSPSLPPLPTARAVAGNREAILEQRLRKLEEDNRQILGMYKTLSKQNGDLLKRLEAPAASTPAPAATGNVPAGREGDNEGGGLSLRARQGAGAQGTDARPFVPESEYRGSDKPPRRKAIVEFAEGLEFASDDGEFKLQFHDLTQAELRVFPLQNTGLVHTGFFLPRQRWYFTGHVTKNIEFYTVINRGYGTLDILDAFLTLRYDPRLRFRIGRMKTPYLYEYYQIAEGDLVAPERSLYTGNLAANRQIGAMFLGELYDDRLGYALGIFNGGRRSFEDTNNAKDVFLFLNAKPFRKPSDEGAAGAEGTGGRTRPNQAIGGERNAYVNEETRLLDYLNIGGSINGGYNQGNPQPFTFRTANDQSTASAAGQLSPAFLQFNQNVIENGERLQWGVHLAWFYKSLFLMSEYGGGYGNYSSGRNAMSTKVPFEGYMAQASYFLTGEQITRRVNIVRPLHDFRIRKGKITGSGAVEVYARYSYLNLGKDVFAAGLADPNLWSNSASTIDLGLNWYLNFYTKIYLDWQHSEFGRPVTTRPGGWERAADLFWLRFQLFF